MDAPYYSDSDNRDDLTQPEPTLCCPCDDAGYDEPATTSIYRGQYKVALPVCAQCKRDWDNREPSDAQMEAAQMAHFERLEEARR